MSGDRCGCGGRRKLVPRREADFGFERSLGRRVAAGMAAAFAVASIVLTAGAADAQPLDCLTDPKSCLPTPPPPSPDACLQDPVGCATSGGGVPVPGTRERPAQPQPAEPKPESTTHSTDEAASPSEPRRDEPRADRRSRPASEETEAAPAPAAAPGSSAAVAEREARVTRALADRLGDAIVESAEGFAFPLGLLAAVAIYLLVQGRIDRKDPKLSVEPVDSSQDVLRFG